MPRPSKSGRAYSTAPAAHADRKKSFAAKRLAAYPGYESGKYMNIPKAVRAHSKLPHVDTPTLEQDEPASTEKSNSNHRNQPMDALTACPGEQEEADGL